MKIYNWKSRVGMGDELEKKMQKKRCHKSHKINRIEAVCK